MEKRKRNSVKNAILGIVFVLVVALLAALPALTAGETEEENKASILSAPVMGGTVNRVLLTGGSIDAQNIEAVTVPSGVEIREYLVSDGDTVEAGDPIALTDRISVMTAITEVQDTLDTLRSDLNTAARKITLGTITVDEDGTVRVGGKEIAKDKLSDYGEYYSLSQQHRDYEALLLELFKLNQTGTVTAPISGMISKLDKTAVIGTSGAEGGRITLLATNIPHGEGEPEEDEQTYTCYAAVLLAVQDGEWTVKKNPISVEITDFLELSAVNTDITAMTDNPEHYTQETVFALVDNEWTTVEAAAGDVLLFAYGDGGAYWVIRMSQAAQPDPDPDPTPTPNPFPGWPNIPNLPNIPHLPSGWSGLGGLGGLGGFSGSQEPALYSMEQIQLCTIVGQDTVVLTVAVDERDISEVAAGMTAQVTLDALPGKTFEAAVTEISKFGAGNGGSSKFSVKLELPYSEGMLPGMNASASMLMEQRQNVLVIPVAALVDRGAETLVYTGYDAKKETLLNPVPVETGLSDGEFVQILSGLTEGTEVWYSYYDVLEISASAETRGMF